jgi:hypothetical protein
MDALHYRITAYLSNMMCSEQFGGTEMNLFKAFGVFPKGV